MGVLVGGTLPRDTGHATRARARAQASRCQMHGNHCGAHAERAPCGPDISAAVVGMPRVELTTAILRPLDQAARFEAEPSVQVVLTLQKFASDELSSFELVRPH